MNFFAATRFRSVLVFRMDSVEKSTVASRHIILLLFCSKALMQREGSIKRMGIVKVGVRVIDTKVWRSVMARALKNGKENGAGKGCFYFHDNHSVGRVDLHILNIFSLRNLQKYFT